MLCVFGSPDDHWSHPWSGNSLGDELPVSSRCQFGPRRLEVPLTRHLFQDGKLMEIVRSLSMSFGIWPFCHFSMCGCLPTNRSSDRTPSNSGSFSPHQRAFGSLLTFQMSSAQIGVRMPKNAKAVRQRSMPSFNFPFSVCNYTKNSILRFGSGSFSIQLPGTKVAQGQRLFREVQSMYSVCAMPQQLSCEHLGRLTVIKWKLENVRWNLFIEKSSHDKLKVN